MSAPSFQRSPAQEVYAMTMPRRAFLTTSAAACAAVAVAAPAMPAATDAVFAAIADFRQANAAWLQALEDCAVADRALQAENAHGFACLRLPPMAGREIRLQTYDEISAFTGALRNACRADGIAWDDAAVAQGMRDELDAERERVEMARSKVNADILEARQETAYMAAARAAETVLKTVPTTPAGLQAFADLMTEMAQADCFLNHHEDTSQALATLATACRALMPNA